MRRDAHARPVAERSAVVAPAAPDLASLVAHYQRELRLLDWRIDVSYAPDLVSSAGQPVWGLCYPTVDAKVAKIVIRDPATPPSGATPEQAAAQVVETVVHELLHLHFAAFGNVYPAEVAAEEQAVWALAEALIRAKDTPDEAMLSRSMLAVIDSSRVKASVGPAQNDVTSALGAALRARFPFDGENCQGPWVQDTFASSVVYELAGVLYELAFTFDGTAATLGAEPVRVIRSYSPAPAPAPPVLAPVAPMSRAATAPGDAPMSAPALSQKLIAMLIETAASGDKKAAPIAAAVLSELLGAAPAEEPKPADPPPDAPPPPARVVPVTVAGSEPDALLAFGRVALALLGKTDPGEGIAEIARRSALAVDLETREGALARDREVLELTERKALVANLVTLRAETPHTSGLATGTLVPRLLAEPIADLRARVVALGGSAPKAPAARVVPGTDPLESLSDRERAMCAEMKLDPATYAAHKARKVG
jgi:hypothetical protein